MLVHAIPSDVSYDFAADVRDGLLRIGQKELPSKYLYDDVGSALFEVISRLPQYGLTRGYCGGTRTRLSTGWAVRWRVRNWEAGAGRKRAGCWKHFAGGSGLRT